MIIEETDGLGHLEFDEEPENSSQVNIDNEECINCSVSSRKINNSRQKNKILVNNLKWILMKQEIH